MPGRNRPSFLKKQKEEQRRARAARKREERQARRQRVSVEPPDLDVSEETQPGIDEEERAAKAASDGRLT